MKTILSCIFSLALLMSSTTVKAQQINCPKPSGDVEKDKDEARRYFNMGNTFFEVADFRQSRDSFLCVISLVPYSVMARFRLARSFEELGQYTLARAQYKWVLVDRSGESAALKPEVEKRVASIENKPDRVEPSDKPEKPVDPGEKPVDPGEKPVDTGEKPVDTGEKPKDPGVQPPPDPEKPGTPGTRTPSLTSQWWFWAGAGSTLVLTVAAIGLGAKALQLKDAWEEDWNEDDRKSLKNYRLFTDIAIGGAVLSAVSLGVGILLWNPAPVDSPTPDTGVSFLPSCGPQGCMMTWSWRF